MSLSEKSCGINSFHRSLKRSERQKAKKHRVNRGYCDADLWCMSDYLLILLPQMLRRFIDISHGYPGYLDGKPITADEYKNMVIGVAERFEKIQKMIDNEDDIPIADIPDYVD